MRALRIEENWLRPTVVSVEIRDSADGRLLHDFQGHNGGVFALLFLDATHLVTGGADRAVQVWDIETRKSSAIPDAHAKPITQFVPLPDGRRIASAGGDGAVRFWNRRALRDLVRGPERPPK